MNEKQVSELIRFLVTDTDLSPAFRNKVMNAIDENVYSVHYDLCDMQDMIDRRNDMEGEEMYSYDNARQALSDMVMNYDTEYGINHYTFDHYIEAYCLIGEVV